MQLERQVVFESVFVGRIHRQALDLSLMASLSDEENQRIQLRENVNDRQIEPRSIEQKSGLESMK